MGALKANAQHAGVDTYSKKDLDVFLKTQEEQHLREVDKLIQNMADMSAKINQEGTGKSELVGSMEDKLAALQAKMADETQLRSQLEVQVGHTMSSKKQVMKNQKQLEAELTKVDGLLTKKNMT